MVVDKKRTSAWAQFPQDFHTITMKCHVPLSWTQNKPESRQWKTWQRSSKEFLSPAVSRKTNDLSVLGTVRGSGDQLSEQHSTETISRDAFQRLLSLLGCPGYVLTWFKLHCWNSSLRHFGLSVAILWQCFMSGALTDLTKACHWARTRISFIHTVSKNRS